MDSSDIFRRVRFLVSELSDAILAAGAHSIGVERARTGGDFRNMERNCAEMGALLAQALQMQAALEVQIAKEPRAKVTAAAAVEVILKEKRR